MESFAKGMKTLGAVFQKLVDLIVGELQPRCVVVYIDDITIFSNSINKHLHDVDKLLAKLDGANLKVNLNKCSFCKKEVLVLGHIVSKEGISPNPKKVEAILESRRPASVTEVKSFLGVVNFYRKFIKNCSTVEEPLILLTRGNKKKGCYFWSEEQEAAFTRLKGMLAKAPVLRFPDWANLFWIECDASSVGIGAVISQLEIGDGEMIRRPISFASRALNRAERNYSVTDREGLALVWAVKTFKPYVFGMPFKVITNHSALKVLLDKKNLEGRMMQWAEFLMGYDCEIIFQPGKENIVADYLSRELLVAEVGPVIEIVEAAKRNVIWVPKEKRPGVLLRSHQSCTGHLREAKLFKFLRECFYWKDMFKDAKQTLMSCDICGRFASRFNQCPLKPIETHYPFELVSLDTGQLTFGNGKKVYFVVAIDHFTRWVEAQVLHEENSKSIMEFIMNNILFRHGCPARIQTDGGLPYVSEAIRHFF